MMVGQWAEKMDGNLDFGKRFRLRESVSVDSSCTPYPPKLTLPIAPVCYACCLPSFFYSKNKTDYLALRRMVYKRDGAAYVVDVNPPPRPFGAESVDCLTHFCLRFVCLASCMRVRYFLHLKSKTHSLTFCYVGFTSYVHPRI